MRVFKATNDELKEIEDVVYDEFYFREKARKCAEESIANLRKDFGFNFILYLNKNLNLIFIFFFKLNKHFPFPFQKYYLETYFVLLIDGGFPFFTNSSRILHISYHSLLH